MPFTPQRSLPGITIAKPPVPRANGAIKPTFVVRSLEAVRTAAAQTGGLMKAASRRGTFEAARFWMAAILKATKFSSSNVTHNNRMQ